MRRRKRKTETPPPQQSTTGSDLEIYRWEIWYVYACYLSRSLPDLRKAATKLLHAKCARAVILPEGEIGFWDQGEVAWCQMFEEDTIAAAGASISFSRELPEDLHAPVMKATATRLAARNVFSFYAPLNDKYIYVILSDLTVYLSESDAVLLDVTAQLFESGIVLISFHLRLGSDRMRLDDFIHRFVNLNQRPLVAAEIEKDLAFLFADAFASEARVPLWRRPFVLKIRQRTKEAFVAKSQEAAIVHKRENNERRIWISGGDTTQLSGLALEYAQAIAYSLGQPRAGIPFLLFGEPRGPEWVGFWAGSPHVHLIKFSGQSTSAAENEQKFEEAFKWILSRMTPRQGRELRIELPENMRAFDDFAVYVNEAVVLWVYTDSERNEEGGSGTREDPIYFDTYHNQVKGDLLEYGRILYMSLRDELSKDDIDWDKIFSVKSRQVQFELDLQQTGQFGEIRDFLAEGLRARRLGDVKGQNAELLSLRESMASVGEDRRFTMTGIVLGILLSLFGVPGLVEFSNEYLVPHIPYLSALDKHSLERTGILVAGSLAGITGVSAFAIGVLKRLRWISRESRISRG